MFGWDNLETLPLLLLPLLLLLLWLSAIGNATDRWQWVPSKGIADLIDHVGGRVVPSVRSVPVFLPTQIDTACKGQDGSESFRDGRNGGSAQIECWFGVSTKRSCQSTGTSGSTFSSSSSSVRKQGKD